MSRAYVVRSWTNVISRVSASGFDLARSAAERALTIEPDLPDGHAALGWVRMLADWDWYGANGALKRALELAPGHVDALRYASLLMHNIGHPDEALKLLRRVVALDPLSWNAFSNLANYFLGEGSADQAGAAVEKCIELNPHGEMTHFILGKVRLEQRRTDEALSAFQRLGGAMRFMGIALAEFLAETSSSQMKPCATLPKGTQTTTRSRLRRLRHTGTN